MSIDKNLINAFNSVLEDEIQDIKSLLDDKRPLTDEALEELGFEWIDDRKEYSMEGIRVIPYHKDKEYLIQATFKPKTIGSVKMLIEALKGDE